MIGWGAVYFRVSLIVLRAPAAMCWNLLCAVDGGALAAKAAIKISALGRWLNKLKS